MAAAVCLVGAQAGEGAYFTLGGLVDWGTQTT